jgi:malate synthase
MDIFDEHMKGPHQVRITLNAIGLALTSAYLFLEQYHLRKEEVSVSEIELIDPTVPGSITDKGVRENISAYVPLRPVATPGSFPL